MVTVKSAEVHSTNYFQSQFPTLDTVLNSDDYSCLTQAQRAWRVFNTLDGREKMLDYLKLYEDYKNEDPKNN
jgi:hypothetical protein